MRKEGAGLRNSAVLPLSAFPLVQPFKAFKGSESLNDPLNAY